MLTVLAASRLPVCAAGGAMSRDHPVDMAAVVLRQVIDEAAIDPVDIDEIWIGCAEPVGAQGADMARAAILSAGLPDAIMGMVVDAAECSGTVALHAAVAAVKSGQARNAVVLGVSNGSLVPPGASALGRTYGRPWSDGPAERYKTAGGLLSPHRAAEESTRAVGFTRTQQDVVVRRSFNRRVDNIRCGDVMRDLPDDLAHLPPAFEPQGSVTAASFAPPADGCSGLLIGSGGDSRLGTIVSVGRSSGNPRTPHGGALAAVTKALDAAKLDASQIVGWEIVETSAAALLCICADLALDSSTVNPHGGALATGDAAAAEEIRLVVDGLRAAESDGPILTLVSGTTGAAATVMRPSK